jgi:hypothetical protein
MDNPKWGEAKVEGYGPLGDETVFESHRKKYRVMISLAVEASQLRPMVDGHEAREWWGPVHREAFRQILADLIRRYADV